MRLPYLQVTQEAWPKSRMLAAVLKISRGDAFLLLCDLWAWGLDLGPADRAPTGEFVGNHAVAMLAGAVNWAGDPALLAEALVDLGLLEITQYGVRVRGLDRYTATWKRNHNVKADQSGTDRQPIGDRPVAARKPKRQTQTQTQIKNLKAAAASVEPPPPAAAAAVPNPDSPPPVGATHTEPERRSSARPWTAPEPAPPPKPSLVLAPDRPAAGPVEGLRQLWNQQAGPGVPRWKRTGADRELAAAACLEVYPLSDWVGLLERISASDFLCGRKPGKDWRPPSVDWFLDPDTLAKLDEGVYDNAGDTPKGVQASGPSCEVCGSSDCARWGDRLLCYAHQPGMEQAATG